MSTMSSDVFIISAARGANAQAAIQQAIMLAGIHPARVQDAVFGLDDFSSMPDVDQLVREAGISCPAACILTSLRAVYFAAASMLSDDAELSLVIGMEDNKSTAFVLASPQAVGGMNLLPRARIAARSLAGAEPALSAAGLVASEVEIMKDGEHAAPMLFVLLDELEAKPAHWGMLAVGVALILVERV